MTNEKFTVVVFKSKVMNSFKIGKIFEITTDIVIFYTGVVLRW